MSKIKKAPKIVPAPKAPEAYAVGLQPSMSWSTQLIECSFAFGLELDRGPASEPARYGSAFHEILPQRITDAVRADFDTVRHKKPPHKLKWPSVDQIARKWGAEIKAEELEPHVDAAFGVLQTWLGGTNEFRIDFHAMRKQGVLFLEQAVALTPLKAGRFLEPHDGDHRYHGLVLGEQPGTLDLAIVGTPDVTKREAPLSGPILVLDHKTGEEDFSRPLDKAQLLSLAAGTMRWVGASEAVVAVLHARRRGMPKVYADRVKLSELREYETRVAGALSRIGDGSMRPGPWCDRCPAKGVCPARDAELMARAGDVLTGLTAAGGALSIDGLARNDVAIVKAPSPGLSKEKRLGLLYTIAKLAETMAGRIRAEIKSEIIADPNLLPSTEGANLIVRSYEKENLSKSSIVEAYGKIAGERMLSRLRRDGAIRTSTVQQLWPEKERGR